MKEHTPKRTPAPNDELYRAHGDQRVGGDGRELLKSRKGKGQQTGEDGRELLEPAKPRKSA